MQDVYQLSTNIKEAQVAVRNFQQNVLDKIAKNWEDDQGKSRLKIILTLIHD
jgi:hypothetical protein